MSKIDLVLEYYGLELNGDDKMCCPFHEEDTPSFQYYPETESWYCWGRCCKGGDMVQFIREMEDGITFKRSVALLEKILGEKVELGKGAEKRSTQAIEEELSPMPISAIKEFQSGKVFQAVNYRGIRKETDEFFRTLSKVDKDGNVIARYYPETRDNKIHGYKCRNHPKDFSYGKVGLTGIKNDLSGQHLFRAGGKYVLYVGGEEDKAAGYQMFADKAGVPIKPIKDGDNYNTIPVVSPTAGEGSAAKQAAKNYDWFDTFDNIIIGMDNDAAGIKAAKEIAEVLPKHKVKVAKWTKKDPNSMLESGMIKQFVSDFWNAKEYIATGIKTASDAMEEVREFLTAPKIPLPPHLHRVQEAHRGGLKSSGFIGNIIADTSVGKTFVTDTLLNFWIPRDDLIPIIVSIERTAGECMADLLSIFLERNLTWFKEGQEAVDFLDKPEVKDMCDTFMRDANGKQRFYVIDERDGSLEVLQNKMEMASAKYDTDLFILDPLTDILRALGNDAQDDHMMWQKQKKKYGWKIINVLHTRKPGQDKDGKPRKVTEYDAYGSGTFVQSSDWNWVLNRTKMAECPIERNTMELDIPKVRGGTTGHGADLYYDVKTRKHHDKKDFFIGQEKEDGEEQPKDGGNPTDDTKDLELF